MAKLTAKQEAFCLEYIVDLNATQSAIRAGYSENTAAKIGYENLLKPDIQNRIDELKAQREERVIADADYVLKRLIEIDQMDALDILNDDGSLKPVSEWPKVWRQFISGFDIATVETGDTIALIKKIKWPDKVKNLELLGKHISVQAFKDKLGVDGNLAINVADAIREARENRLNK